MDGNTLPCSSQLPQKKRDCSATSPESSTFEGTVLKLNKQGEPADLDVGAYESHFNLEAVVIWAVELIHEDYELKEDE